MKLKDLLFTPKGSYQMWSTADDDYDDYRGGSTFYMAKDKDENLTEEETIKRLEKMDITVIENFLRDKKLKQLRNKIGR